MQTYNKFFASLIAPVVATLVLYFQENIGVDLSGVEAELVLVLSGAASAVLVYLIPNKTPETSEGGIDDAR